MSEKTIPASWANVPIEDCLLPYPNGKKIRQGWSPQCENFPARTHDDWGVLRTSAIQDGYYLEQENKHLPEALEPRTHLEVEAGDILITCAGPRSRCGVTCLVRSTRSKLLISGKMYQLRADPEIVDRHLLELFLREPRTKHRIDELKTGINDSGLNLTHDRFKTLEVPLPPLAEQKRIVAKIEELFSELDAGEESLRRARRQLGIYRQSLLKQAFEGKLTAPWRAQHPDLLESPDQLLARIQAERQARYQQQLKEWERAGGGRGKPKKPEDICILSDLTLASPSELPQGWAWLKIADIGRIETGTTPPTNDPANYGGDTPFFKPTDLEQGANVREAREHLSAKGRNAARILPAGTTLVTCIGATIGKTGLASVECATNQQINTISPEACLEPQFVYYAAIAPTLNGLVKSEASATTLPILNKSKFESLPFPLCSLPEQQEIVRLLDAQFEVIEQNEREIDAALKRSEALRQSILKKAFTGQLVPPNPTDEPASALLERIRAGRSATPSSTNRRTKAGK